MVIAAAAVVVVVVVVDFYTSLSLAGNSSRLTAIPRAAPPIPINVCSIFVCPYNGIGCQCVGFLTRERMMTPAIAHGDCTINGR